MTWSEWEQARERVTATRLNGLDDGSGGYGRPGDAGGRDLAVRDDELGALGGMAYELRLRLTDDGDHARESTSEAATGLTADGMSCGKALTELHDAWITKVGTLKEACAHISNHLDYTRGAHAKDEEKITTSMRNAEGKEMTVSRIHDYIK
ncbi:hypothetical protein QNO07_05605 [Streptomyces sp. 549]|uniref:hypothetical protein n=1 Tax=Streptomyces sp. 549 TaxID=3049076 RepID=UPI0024C45B27|nr:hypothetical protein [Streptomyces sp. 549]MDK1472911.1 hypothetical protein [Streptomyces sp. 549]